jgi:undecaprenyl-diphosphatase
MGWLEAILLGTVQGLTEFLPVSSSGHLVLLQSLFGMEEPDLFFDVSVHVGTLVAVCLFFWTDLRRIGGTLFSTSTWQYGDRRQRWKQMPEMRLLGLICVGSIPTVLLGLVFRPLAATLFASVRIVGVMLFITGILLWFTRGVQKKGRGTAELTVWDGLCVGLMQGLAILPGISRSGSTIAVGLFKGLDRETAARYSFLLSIPAIVGAMALQLAETQLKGIPLGPTLLGTCAAAAVGYGALKTLIGLVKKGELYLFSFYCWLLGGVALWVPY